MIVKERIGPGRNKACSRSRVEESKLTILKAYDDYVIESRQQEKDKDKFISIENSLLLSDEFEQFFSMEKK